MFEIPGAFIFTNIAGRIVGLVPTIRLWWKMKTIKRYAPNAKRKDPLFWVILPEEEFRNIPPEHTDSVIFVIESKKGPDPKIDT